MLKAIARAGWLVISRKERAVRVRTGQTSETDSRRGESCWQRQDVETDLLGVHLFLLVTFSWAKNQDASFLFSGICLNKAFSNFFLWWESWETFPPISCPLSTGFCPGGTEREPVSLCKQVGPKAVNGALYSLPEPAGLVLIAKFPGGGRESGSAGSEGRGRSPSPPLFPGPPWVTSAWGSGPTWIAVPSAGGLRRRTSPGWFRTHGLTTLLILPGRRLQSPREARASSLWLSLITRLGRPRTWASTRGTSSKSWTSPTRAGGWPGTWRKGPTTPASSCRATFLLTTWLKTGASRQSREYYTHYFSTLRGRVSGFFFLT